MVLLGPEEAFPFALNKFIFSATLKNKRGRYSYLQSTYLENGDLIILNSYDCNVLKWHKHINCLEYFLKDSA